MDALTNCIVLLETRTVGDSGQGRRDLGDAGVGLVDEKFFTAELLSLKDIFREWSEDFTDCIKLRDGELGNLLEAAKYVDVAMHASWSSAVA